MTKQKKELDKIKIEEDIESEFDSIIGNDYDSPTVLTSNQFKNNINDDIYIDLELKDLTDHDFGLSKKRKIK